MMQHPPKGVCALSSPNGVCSSSPSGCANIKLSQNCDFWNIVGVNTNRAVARGSGQPGVPQQGLGWDI